MLTPALAQALAIAHIEDLHRAAARRHMIHLARRVAHEPRVAAPPSGRPRSAPTRLGGRRSPTAAAPPRAASSGLGTDG